MLLLGVLFSYFTYTSKNWVESVNTDLLWARAVVAPKVERIQAEQETSVRRLDRMEQKIDQILDKLRR